MKQAAVLLKDTPVFSNFDRWSLQYLASLSKRVQYKPGEWLFEECTLPEWFGIIEKGAVSIVEGPADQRRCLATLKEGAILSEHIFLNDLPHAVGCFTQDGAIVLQLSRRALQEARRTRPDLYYRIGARIAFLVCDRLRYAPERLAIEDFSYPRSDMASYRHIWKLLMKQQNALERSGSSTRLPVPSGRTADIDAPVPGRGGMAS